MTTAVDTNVLLDLLGGEPLLASAARRALDLAVGEGSLVLCPIVYSELAAGFGQGDQLEQFLHDLGLRVDSFSSEALWRAGEAWLGYARRRGQEVQCPRCGARAGVICPSCQAPIAWRQHLIPDFLIGAHALVQADRLLTRDPGYYQTYFPRLRIETPLGISPDRP